MDEDANDDECDFSGSQNLGIFILRLGFIGFILFLFGELGIDDAYGG